MQVESVKSLKKYLRAFFDIIDRIRMEPTITMAIGGIWALKLHGLITRDSEDLDIIIYNPTQEFIEFIDNQRGRVPGSQPIPQDSLGNNWRSFKVERDGVIIDFIIEWEEQPSEESLLFNYRSYLIRVQDIETVIEKKRIYGRKKDHSDFEKFKSDNFNY